MNEPRQGIWLLFLAIGICAVYWSSRAFSDLRINTHGESPLSRELSGEELSAFNELDRVLAGTIPHEVAELHPGILKSQKSVILLLSAAECYACVRKASTIVRNVRERVGGEGYYFGTILMSRTGGVTPDSLFSWIPERVTTTESVRRALHYPRTPLMIAMNRNGEIVGTYVVTTSDDESYFSAWIARVAL